MTTFLDRMLGTFTGIEFREDQFVVAKFTRTLTGVKLISFKTFPLRDDEGNLSEIKKYIQQQGIDTSKAFVSVPDKWALVRFIEVPSPRGKNTLPQLMRFEIGRHIPFQIEDVYYDFQVMHEREGISRVVFTVLHREKVEYVRGFLEKLSVPLHGITISSFSIMNVIESSKASKERWEESFGIIRKSSILGQKGETNILLYINGKNIILAIIKDGFYKHLKCLSFNSAESLEECVDNLIASLRETPSGFTIEGTGKLILCGDKSFVPLLAEILKERLRVDIVTIDPLSTLPANFGRIMTGEVIPSLGACFAGIGMGTFRLNLLPHKTVFEIIKIASLSTKILLGLILLLIIMIFTSELIKQKMLLEKVEEALKKNQSAVKVIERLSSDINSLKKRRDFLLDVKKNEFTLEVLAELTRVLPVDSWITNLDYKGFRLKKGRITSGEMLISGYATSSSGLIPILEDSPFFERVEFVGPIKKVKEKEMFKLRARVVNPVR